MNNKELEMLDKWFKNEMLCGRQKCAVCRPLMAKFRALLDSLDSKSKMGRGKITLFSSSHDKAKKEGKR